MQKFFRQLIGQGLIWKFQRVHSSKNELWTHIQLAFIYILIFDIFTKSWLDIVGLILLYIQVWRAANKILVRLEEVETLTIQCAWCGKVKKAGEYTDAVSHSICPTCFKKEIQ